MGIVGKIKTLFSDKDKTEALFPRTKISAVSDDDGTGLNVILDNINTEISEIRESGGGGGASVQADLAQNDPTQPDYVKNRTHWVESGDMTDIPVNGMWANQGDGMYMLVLVTPLDLEIGKTYTVTWDGVDYAGIAHEGEYNGIPCVCLGNTALYFGTGDTGEPFALAEFPAEAVATVGAYGLAGATDFTDGHTISIYRGAVHKLNNKFVDFQPVLNAVAKDVEEAKEVAKSESYDAMTAYVRDQTRTIEIWLTSSIGAEWISFGKEYTKKLSLTHADKLQMRIAGATIYFSFYSSLDVVDVHPVVAGDDIYITFFLNDYTIDGVDYSGKEYGVVTIKIDKDNNLTMRAKRVPLTDDHINSLIDNKVGELRTYVESVFEELRELIQNGGIESTIAVLDEAILDVSVLA